LKPFRVAAEKGQAIARQLLDAGWQPRRLRKHYNPGTYRIPDNELPAIRLFPPEIDPGDENAWFIELLDEESGSGEGPAHRDYLLSRVLGIVGDPSRGSNKGIRSVHASRGFCFIQSPHSGKPGSAFS